MTPGGIFKKVYLHKEGFCGLVRPFGFPTPSQRQSRHAPLALAPSLPSAFDFHLKSNNKGHIGRPLIEKKLGIST